MFNFQSNQSGFTLIELLVVIAIIGIMSSVVLASLSDARQSARDSAIKQQMKSLVAVAELNRIKTGSFIELDKRWSRSEDCTGTCTQPLCATDNITGPYETDLRNICQGIEDQSGLDTNTLLHWGVGPGFNINNEIAFMVRLNSGDFYCLSTSGGSYEGPINPGTGNWTGAGCWNNP